MLPSGSTGTARAKARPSRGPSEREQPPRPRRGRPASRRERTASVPRRSSRRAAAARTAPAMACGPRRVRAGGSRRPLRGRGRAVAAAAQRGGELAVAGGRLAGSGASAWSTSATSGFGRSGPDRSRARGRRGRSASAISRNGPPPNGCRPASASQRRTPTDQTSVAGPAVLPAQPLRRDVRERSRDVAGGGQRLLLGDERESEVEEPHGDVRAVGRAGRSTASRRGGRSRGSCAWASPSRIWAAASTAASVVELAALQRLAERAPGDVLVGDVDVAVVAGERVARAGRPDGEAAPPPPPRARRAGRPFPVRGTIFSATSRPLLARPGRARPNPCRRCRAAGAAGTGPARGRRYLRLRRRLRHPADRFRAGRREVLWRTRNGLEWAEIPLQTGLMTEHETDLDFDFFDDDPRSRRPDEEERPRGALRGGGPPPAALGPARRSG